MSVAKDNLEAALLRLRQSRDAYSPLLESEDFTAVAEVEDMFRALSRKLKSHAMEQYGVELPRRHHRPVGGRS
jgi:hypothetical protein